MTEPTEQMVTAANEFVRDVLTAVQRAGQNRTLITAALLEAAGALARQDVLDDVDGQRFTFYAEAFSVLEAHVLAPLPGRRSGVSH